MLGAASHPLADRVVRHAVAPRSLDEPEFRDLRRELRARRPRHLSRMWTRSTIGARARTEFLRGFARAESLTTPGADTHRLRRRIPAAVGIEGRCAVRTDDAEVLEAVVVSDTVDVIEDERHLAPAPCAALTAELAGRQLQAGLVEAFLQVPAAVRRALDENLVQRCCSAPACRSPSGIRVEMICRYLPAFNVPAERAVIPTGVSQSKPAECLAVGTRVRNRLRRLGARICRSSHERMFASRPDA